MSNSNVNSETFLPHFREDAKTGLLFIDIAGLHDSSTPIIQMLNSFMLQCILNQAETVRLLVAVPYSKITDRVLNMRDDFKAVQEMCFNKK